MVMARMPRRCNCNIITTIGKAALVMLSDVNDKSSLQMRWSFRVWCTAACSATQLRISSTDIEEFAKTIHVVLDPMRMASEDVEQCIGATAFGSRCNCTVRLRSMFYR